jgi:hypothetical protein
MKLRERKRVEVLASRFVLASQVHFFWLITSSKVNDYIMWDRSDPYKAMRNFILRK